MSLNKETKTKGYFTFPKGPELEPWHQIKPFFAGRRDIIQSEQEEIQVRLNCNFLL